MVGSEVCGAVISVRFQVRPNFFCTEKGFNRVRSLSMHSPYCLFVSHWCLSYKTHHIPKWRYEISFLLSKQSMILYLFRKISSQYGTEMLQTKQPQQELGKFLSKFILKNHTISKNPPPIPPPPNTNTKSPNLKWYSLLYIKLYYFGPLTRGSQSCIQGCH